MAEAATVAPAKGPSVWMDMDQEALDDAYDQAKYAANMQQIIQRRAAESKKVRELLKPERIAYGPTDIEQVDIYKTAHTNAPISIFIHGGAWRDRRACDVAVQAEMFVRAGAHH